MTIPIPDYYSGDLKSWLFEGRISNGPVFKWLGLSNGYSHSPNHSKIGSFEIRMFFIDFRCHSKSRSFATQPLLDHSKSRLGRISDPHCTEWSRFWLVKANHLNVASFGNQTALNYLIIGQVGIGYWKIRSDYRTTLKHLGTIHKC